MQEKPDKLVGHNKESVDKTSDNQRRFKTLYIPTMANVVSQFNEKTNPNSSPSFTLALTLISSNPNHLLSL